jgi:hypothetical protein
MLHNDQECQSELKLSDNKNYSLEFYNKKDFDGLKSSDIIMAYRVEGRGDEILDIVQSNCKVEIITKGFKLTLIDAKNFIQSHGLKKGQRIVLRVHCLS